MRNGATGTASLDEFARKILTSRGGITDDPASVYFAISKDANDTVERVTQVFCGVRMLCARCHSHPMENWTQADYYGLASFFTQVSTPPDARFRTVPNTKRVQLNLAAGNSVNPRSGKPQAFDHREGDGHGGELRDVVEHHLQPRVGHTFNDLCIGGEETVIRDALVVERR